MGRLEALPESASSAAARLLAPTLAAINAFLLCHGRDCAAAAAGMHTALHAAVVRSAQAKDTRLREAALAYLRIQLQLGSLAPGSPLLQDVQEWVERELGAPALKW